MLPELEKYKYMLQAWNKTDPSDRLLVVTSQVLQDLRDFDWGNEGITAIFL